MSIWGKIIGGAAGFALGGPIGALLGAVAGHAVDTLHEQVQARQDSTTRSIAFTIALIALSAKMAKADGTVSRKEIEAFRDKVDIPPGEMASVGRIWDLARQTTDGFESYARQLASLFPAGGPVLEQLLAMLFHIARVDGTITSAEQAYLERVAELLGFDAAAFDRLQHLYGDPESSPYTVLGVEAGIPDRELRKAWLGLVRNYHPDKLMAEGLPEEFIRSASEKIATINAAYDQIMTLRMASRPTSGEAG